MPVVNLAQLGFGAETALATPVVVDRFFEFRDESFAGKYERIESTALRAGTRIQRADRWTANPKGAAGTATLEVLTKGYAYWLDKMLGGTVTVSSANADGFKTFTASPGSLTGKSFTAQVGRPDVGDVVYSFVYAGGKIVSWEIANDVDGILMLNLDMDFVKEFLPGDTSSGSAGALATVSYPAGSEVMSSLGGSFKIGGVEIPAKAISFKGDNQLATERYFVSSTNNKREQLENDMRQYTWSATVEFNGVAQMNRVAALANAGAQASISGSWRGPTITGATYPSLTIAAPTARWDEGIPAVNGPNILEHTISGKILAPTNGDPALTISLVSTDTAV